jgi:hypothetical protein
MDLDSYVCENCILQKKTEYVYHLFLRCNFTMNCWSSIGILVPRERCPQRAAIRLMRQLDINGALEILILMCWSIRKCRKGWIFESITPSVERCRIFFSQELKWLQLRAKAPLSPSISS